MHSDYEELLKAVEDATRRVEEKETEVKQILDTVKHERAVAVKRAMDAPIPRRLIQNAAGVKSNVALAKIMERHLNNK